MVATGAGYTLLPSLAVGPRPPLKNLVRYIELGGKQQYGRKIVMAWRQSFNREAEIQLLADLVGGALPKYIKQS